ncbi:MAG: GNAT family N-acetyltransferase [Anaerolineae bacterium]|nr:GNAT family N-acetyltransferase [Anaerolineae bacterium]
MTTLHWIEPTKRERLAPLFANHKPSVLTSAVLEGHLGAALADDETAPHVARLAYADVVIFGGDVQHPMARELVETVPMEKGILPSPDGWYDLLQAVHGERIIAVERYAFSAEALDRRHLQALRNDVPSGYELRRIDLDLAQQIANNPDLISPDHVCNFESPEDFVKRGIGFCILYDGRIVSGASSYAICNRGIEVQVNTHADHQKRGLATTVSAALLAYCLEHKLEVNWDAANMTSARLAERLGYTPRGAYEMLVRIG